jgi:phospholipid/cholesterol/gamma-HCH transport system ATP-binding protein
VVGGSGTGKSVLMRSIIGLQIPTRARCGCSARTPIGAEPDEEAAVRSRWGVLFQGGALFSMLTVAENVEVPLKQFYPELEPELLHEIARYKVKMSGLPEEAASKYPSSCRAGCASAPGWRARWRSIPSCCSSTSRPRGSTRSARRRSTS